MQVPSIRFSETWHQGHFKVSWQQAPPPRSNIPSQLFALLLSTARFVCDRRQTVSISRSSPYQGAECPKNRICACCHHQVTSITQRIQWPVKAFHNCVPMTQNFSSQFTRFSFNSFKDASIIMSQNYTKKSRPYTWQPWNIMGWSQGKYIHSIGLFIFDSINLAQQHTFKNAVFWLTEMTRRCDVFCVRVKRNLAPPAWKSAKVQGQPSPT